MAGLDIYILDSAYRRSEVVSDYISVAWNEKFNEYGDFEIVVPYSDLAVSRLATGTMVGAEFSDRVMKIHTAEQTEDADGKKLLKATGKSLEYILTGRIAWRDLEKMKEENNEWVVSRSAYNHVDLAVRKAILGESPFHSYDTIPDIRTGVNLYPADTNVVPGSPITVSQANPTDVYSYIEDICKIYGIGYRIYRDSSRPEGGLLYNTYKGRNLTRSQSTSNPVIFSMDLDNIESVKFYESHDDWVSGVWVFSTNGVTSVFRDGTSNSKFKGFNRIIKTMNVSEPDGMTAAERADYRTQLGMEELLETNPVFVVEGEISQSSQYKYHRDYELGDLVELMGPNGYSSRMRVSEQIFTVTSEGLRSYPGLTTEDTISVGHWAGYGDVEWVNATGDWADQPTQ